MTTGLSIAALVVSGFAAFFTWKAVRAADRSAGAAESADRQARTPRLAVLLDNPVPAPSDLVIYRVRNDGPQDLDSLVIYQPRPSDQISYPIAATGGGGKWVDEVRSRPS